MSVVSPVASTTQDTCIHKLPTSCLLTATQNCCACADRRLHSAAYPVYIDGIGIVSRGTRWERYCWSCKEFWDTRLAATRPRLRFTQTRIPDTPNQSDFLRNWYDLQRGYRLVRNDSGVEERVSLPRSLEGLSPGRLPSPFDDLPSPTLLSPSAPVTSELQFDLSASRDSEALVSRRHSLSSLRVQLAELVQRQEDFVQSREEFAQVREERNRHQVDLQHRRISLLRSELSYIRGALRRVVTDLQGLGSEMDSSTPPVSSEGATPVPVAGPSSPSAGNSQTQAAALLRQRQDDLIFQTFHNSRRPVAEAHSPTLRPPESELVREYQDRHREFEAAHRNLARLRNEHRAAVNMSQTFGTREEVERAGENYQSPVGALFQSAYANYNRAEAHRQGQQPPTGLLPMPHLRRAQRPGEQGDLELTQSLTNELSTQPAQMQRPSLFGPTPESGPISPTGYPTTPTVNTPGSMQNFQHMPQMPYIHGSPYVGLPPLASHYGSNYGSSQPGHTPGGALGNTHLPAHGHTRGTSALSQPGPDFGSTGQTMYDRANNRPYVPEHHVPHTPYPRPPESRRDFPVARGAHSYRLERRNRYVDTEHMGYQYEYMDDMDFEEARDRGQPRAGESSVRGLDSGTDGRPAAKGDEELKVSLECKVCMSQLVDTVLLPCGHAIMCQWCADQHVPCHKSDKTRPIGISKCPMCRKPIKQKVRMYRG